LKTKVKPAVKFSPLGFCPVSATAQVYEGGHRDGCVLDAAAGAAGKAAPPHHHMNTWPPYLPSSAATKSIYTVDVSRQGESTGRSQKRGKHLLAALIQRRVLGNTIFVTHRYVRNLERKISKILFMPLMMRMPLVLPYGLKIISITCFLL
jgi:hypothetical protein